MARADDAAAEASEGSCAIVVSGTGTREVLFVHISKTGGTSISAALGLVKGRAARTGRGRFQRHILQPRRAARGGYDTSWHWTAREFQSVLGARAWEEAFKFSFVRNPWDRVVSQFFYRRRIGLLQPSVSFAQWVRAVYGEGRTPSAEERRHFMPQVEWVIGNNGRIELDYLGRFESLAVDFLELTRRLGVGAALPHLNASDRGRYRAYYTDETAEIVGKAFVADLAAFNYRF